MAVKILVQGLKNILIVLTGKTEMFKATTKLFCKILLYFSGRFFKSCSSPSNKLFHDENCNIDHPFLHNNKQFKRI